jgi:hypothetical protein
MRFRRLSLFSFCFLKLTLALAEDLVDRDQMELVAEYGFSSHAVTGKEKQAGTKGLFTAPTFPYVLGHFRFNFNPEQGLIFFYRFQLTKFDEPTNATIRSREVVLQSYGFELQNKLSPLWRLNFFTKLNQRPNYRAITPTEFAIFPKKFMEPGVSLVISQRRRVGLLWGVGAKGFLLLPTGGDGNFATESGYGVEGLAYLGWVGPMGSLYKINTFYNLAYTPNAQVDITYDEVGYGLSIGIPF